MNKRGVKGDRDQRILPDVGVIVRADRQSFRRNDAERMIDEMIDEVCEQNEPAGQPDLPHAGRCSAGDVHCSRRGTP